MRDEVPVHPVCRATADPSPDFPNVGHEMCRSDDDCLAGVNGRCVYVALDVAYQLWCRYDECFEDADCPVGHACAPTFEGDPSQVPQSNLFCLRASCLSSADCSGGQACTLHYTSSSGIDSPMPRDFHYACGADECSPGTPTSTYRFTRIEIPTRSDVSSGATLGHNVDGVGETCGVVDYASGVDNALIEFNARLAELGSEPLDLQAELDEALDCRTSGGEDCEPLSLGLHVQQCHGSTFVQVVLGDDEVFNLPVAAASTGGSGFRVELPHFPLRIPIRTPSGSSLLFLDFYLGILTGKITATGLSDLVIGGMLVRGNILSSFETVLPELPSGPTEAEVETLLDSLYDAQYSSACAALTLGLRAEVELDEHSP